MFFLLPIGHENQVVQRLPYVTIAIIVLNVLIFAGTRRSTLLCQREYLEKFDNIVEFYSRHTDLDIEEIVKDEYKELKLVLHEIKKEYSYIHRGTSTSSDKDELIEMLDELQNIKYSVPSYKYGLIPSNPRLFNFFSSIFMHGGFFHLLFNMLFLWIAGCTIEDKWGRPLYLCFYLLSGVVAAYAHVLMFPKSSIPLIGASGAIAGAMGAFLVRMYKTRIRIIYVIWLFIFYAHSGDFFVPAYVALPFWFLQQIYYALASAGTGETGGVAFWAHIGGFVFGAIMAVVIKKYNFEEKYIQPNIEKKISISQHPKLLSAMEKFDQENYEEAITDITEYLKLEPNHLEANIILGQIYLKQDKKNDAARIYRKLVSIYLSEKNTNLALSTYMDMKNLSKDAVLPPRDQMNIAHLFEADGNILEATEAYDRLIQNYPSANESMKAAVTYGDLCLGPLNQPEKALMLFQKAKRGCKIYPEWTEKVEEGLKKASDLLNKDKGTNFTGIAKENNNKDIASEANFTREKVEDSENKDININIMPFEMRLTKLYNNGIMLEGKNRGLFKWEQIKYIGVGDIYQNEMEDMGDCRRIIDLIYNIDPDSIKLIRIQEKEIEYEPLFKDSLADREQNFNKLIKILINYSKADIIPKIYNKDNQGNESFLPKFKSLKSYEEVIKSTVTSMMAARSPEEAHIIQSAIR
ncbi:MAG: rhomboid family intramembrane serine protease [bacterium]